MALSGIGSTAGVQAALGATYRRFAADAPRDERSTAQASARYYVRTPGADKPRAATGNTPAGLLGALIERMGGGADSRSKGSYVNLRV